MALSNFWVPLLLLLLIMKPSHEDSEKFENEEESDLKLYLKRMTDLEQLNKNYYGKNEVRIYIEIYT